MFCSLVLRRVSQGRSPLASAAIFRAVRSGLMPITIGLMFASATILMRTVSHDWRGYLISLLTAAVVLRRPWNPLWLLAAGALAGVAGIV